MRALHLLGLALLLTGCSGNSNDKGKPTEQKPVSVSQRHSGDYPIRVVCTTGMVADLARRVGGSKVLVEQLMGEDVDPHLYRVNAGDMEKLGQAHVILYSGLHLEGKMGDTLSRMGKKVPSVGVADHLDPARMLAEEEGVADPHVWFDVALWNETVDIVAQVFSQYDPTHADDYKARAADYRKELAKLHDSVTAKLKTIPKDQRVLVTSHDAFRYFGRAYDIEVHGVQGISTDAEASLKHVEELVNLIVAKKVKAIFVETSVSDRNIKSIREGCRARGHEVALGGQLFSDAMGAPGTPTGAYSGMIEHNVDTIVRALR